MLGKQIAGAKKAFSPLEECLSTKFAEIWKIGYVTDL